MRLLRIVIITLIGIILCAEHAFCFDLDMTVEDDIRKNYNSSKLVNDAYIEEEGLPELPEKLKNNANNSVRTAQPKPVHHYPPANNFRNTKIKKGTTFKVFNVSQISDWQKRGTTVKFMNKKPINNKKYTIPASTVFIGEIIESHQPQITCNGGLVVIRVRSMVYKGHRIPLNAYVTKANDKNVFFNDIKGERTYVKTMWKKGSWGRVLFNKMLALTINLGSEGSTLILSPFPFLYGSICLGANTVVSPITAFFSKGKHVSIPAGSPFKIKLLDDTFID